MNLNKIKQMKKSNQPIKQEVHLVYIIVTSNNVLFTITDLQGKTLLTYSSGAAQYKNHQKKKFYCSSYDRISAWTKSNFKRNN